MMWYWYDIGISCIWRWAWYFNHLSKYHFENLKTPSGCKLPFSKQNGDHHSCATSATKGKWIVDLSAWSNWAVDFVSTADDRCHHKGASPGHRADGTAKTETKRHAFFGWTQHRVDWELKVWSVPKRAIAAFAGHAQFVLKFLIPATSIISIGFKNVFLPRAQTPWPTEPGWPLFLRRGYTCTSWNPVIATGCTLQLVTVFSSELADKNLAGYRHPSLPRAYSKTAAGIFCWKKNAPFHWAHHGLRMKGREVKASAKRDLKYQRAFFAPFLCQHWKIHEKKSCNISFTIHLSQVLPQFLFRSTKWLSKK